MKKILLVFGVLLVLSNAWGKELLEQEIERGVWRVQYRHEGSYNRYEAYRKATCNLVRLAEKQGYSYFVFEDPWVGEENWPPPRGYTKQFVYRLEANVRFSSEPVAGGLPPVEELQERLMCGKWTVAYLKDSQTVQTLKVGWGMPEKVQDFWDVQLVPGTEMQTAGDTVDQYGQWVPGQLSLELPRAPDEVVVSIGCRLKRGTLSWEVYDPTGAVVWEGSSEERKPGEEKRFPGAAGEWGCRLNLDAGRGVCRIFISAVRE